MKYKEVNGDLVEVPRDVHDGCDQFEGVEDDSEVLEHLDSSFWSLLHEDMREVVDQLVLGHLVHHGHLGDCTIDFPFIHMVDHVFFPTSLLLFYFPKKNQTFKQNGRLRSASRTPMCP